MKPSHFFAFLSRMKYINRWGLMRNTRTENIAEHSLEAAMLAHGLCVVANSYFGQNLDAARACLLAVYHDASEVITGDMPTPIKYLNPAIKDTYKEIERAAGQRIIEMLPCKLRPSYRGVLLREEEDAPLWLRVKAADKLCAYIKCLEELKAGNKEFRKASETIYKALKDFNLPEVEFFLEGFIESFSLTLDELNPSD